MKEAISHFLSRPMFAQTSYNVGCTIAMACRGNKSSGIPQNAAKFLKSPEIQKNGEQFVHNQTVS